MSTIVEIDGVGRVELDDGFRDLDPQRQQAIVDEIAQQHGGGGGPAQDAGGDEVGVMEGLGNQVVAGFQSLGADQQEAQARRVARGVQGDDTGGLWSPAAALGTPRSMANRLGEAEAYAAARMDPSVDEPMDHARNLLDDAMAERLRIQAERPMSDRSSNLMADLTNLDDGTFWDKTRQVGSTLRDAGFRDAAQLGAEVAARETPTLAAGAAGSAVGGPSLGAAVMAGVDFGRVRDDQALRVGADMGYDMNTDEGRAEALANPEFAWRVEREGGNQGLVAGAASGVSGAVSGVPLGRTVGGNVGAQTGVQAGIGAAADAGMNAVVGEMPDPGSMTVSAMADAAMATPQMVAVGQQYQDQLREAFQKFRDRGFNPDEVTVDDVVTDAFDGDETANEFLRDIGLDPDSLPPELRERAEGRILARRAEESERSLSAPPDPAQMRSEQLAIETGDMDPGAASTVGRTSPELPRPSIAMPPPMPEVRPPQDRREPVDPDQAATESQREAAARVSEGQREADTRARQTFDMAERRRQRMEGTATPETPPTSRDPRPAGRPEGDGTQEVTLMRTPEGDQPVQVAATLEDGSAIVIPMVTQTTGRREHQQTSMVMDEDAQPMRIPASQVSEVLRTGQWAPEARQAQEFRDAQQPRSRLSPADVRPAQPGGGPQAGGDVTTRQVARERPARQETIPPDEPQVDPRGPRPQTPEDAASADMGPRRTLLDEPSREVGQPEARGRDADGPAPEPQQPTPRDPRQVQDRTVRPTQIEQRGQEGDPLGMSEEAEAQRDQEFLRERQAEFRGRRSRARPLNQRHPLSRAVRSESIGGIAPTETMRGETRPTPVAQELAARGITPRSHPRLFRRDGRVSLDNIPANELGDPAIVADTVGVDESTGYVDQQGLIDALEHELMQDRPTALTQQDVDAVQRHTSDTEARADVDRMANDPDHLRRRRQESEAARQEGEAEATPEAEAGLDPTQETEADAMERAAGETPRQQRPSSQPRGDLFDQDDARGEVGERQTDLEDIIAETHDAFEEGASAAEALFGEEGAQYAGEPRDAPRGEQARREQFREGLASANREAANDPNLTPDDQLTAEQQRVREEADYKVSDYLRDISDVPFSNPFFDPRFFRAMFNSIRAEMTKLRNRLKSSTSLTPPSDGMAAGRARQAQRSPTAALFHRFTATYHGYARYLAKGTNSQTFENIMGSIFTPPGQRSSHRGGTVRERIDAKLAQQQNRYTKATRGMSKESKVKVVAALRGRKTREPLTQAEQQAKNETRAILDDMLDYMRDAGVDVGRVRKDYFPREYEPDAILRDSNGFIENARRLYERNGASRNDAYEQAKALVHHLTTGDDSAFSGGPTGQQSSIFKDREFGPQADRAASDGGLADFMSDDLDHIMSRYLTRGTRRAEIARQYGDQFANRDEMTRKMLDEGVPSDAIEALWDFARVQAGIVPAAHTNHMQFALSWMHTLGTMSLLDRATQTSFTEIYMGAIQSGEVSQIITETFAGVRDLMRHVARLGPNERSRAAYELAEALGMVSTDSVMTAQIARHHGTDQVSRTQAEVLGHYFHAIQMTQFDNRNRMRAMLQGVRLLRKAGRALDGQSALMGQDDAARTLSSLGIQDADQRRVMEKLKRIEKDIPAPEDFAGTDGELLQQALYRFANQWSVQRPTPATKPGWANHPYGRIVFSLMSFPYSFTKNVIYHQGANVGRAAKRASQGELMQAAALATPAFAGAAWLVASRGLFDEMRDAFDEEVLDQDLPNMTDAARVERAVARSGLTGGLDPILQTVTGTRYNRGVADTALGPHFGALADSFDKGMNLAANNNPDTFNAERQALNSAWFWGTGVAHGILSRYTPSPVAIAGMQALRGSRDDVLDAYTPVEQNRGDFTPNQSLAEILYYQWTNEEAPDHRLTRDEARQISDSRRAVRERQRETGRGVFDRSR